MKVRVSIEKHWVIVFFWLLALASGHAEDRIGSYSYGFDRFSKKIERGLPVAIFITPDFQMVDGQPRTDSTLDSARIFDVDTIKGFLEAFKSTRQPGVQWPQNNGNEHVITIVFSDGDPLVNIRTLEGGEGRFFVFQEYDDKGKLHRDIFKVGAAVGDIIKRNIIAPTDK